MDWFATLPVESEADKQKKVQEAIEEGQRRAQYAEEQAKIKHAQLIAQYAEEEEQANRARIEHEQLMARYAEEQRRHEQQMAQYAEEQARYNQTKEEERTDSLNIATTNVQPMRSLRSTPSSFDVVVYIDHHGECSPITDPTLFKKRPPGTKLSLMRSGEYGSVSTGGIDIKIIEDAIKDIMIQNPTKDAVFKGLQRMFRYRKKDRSTEQRTREASQRAEDHNRNIGWRYEINVTDYYNTYYSSDEVSNSARVVYVDGGNMKVGDEIPGSGGRNSLEKIIRYLVENGYKNIGIIEHACNYVYIPGPGNSRQYTIRGLHKVRSELREKGVAGGTRKRKKSKKLKSRRKYR